MIKSAQIFILQPSMVGGLGGLFKKKKSLYHVNYDGTLCSGFSGPGFYMIFSKCFISSV